MVQWSNGKEMRQYLHLSKQLMAVVDWCMRAHRQKCQRIADCGFLLFE